MKDLRYPPFVHIEVTPECNHNCIHCYNYWRKDSTCEKFKFDLEKSLAIVRKVIENKPNTVVITGGEPLLIFDEVKEIVKLFKENGIHVSINTNATLINDDIIEFARKYKLRFFVSLPSGVEEVCDFITGRKGSLKRIVSSLDKLYEAKIPFNLNIVVSKTNIDHVMQSAAFFIGKYSLKKIFITRVGKPVNSDDTFNKYLLDTNDVTRMQQICVQLHKDLNVQIDTGCPFPICGLTSKEAFELFADKKMCTAGKTSYAIDSFGNMKACPRDSKIYGNILEDDFKEVIDNMKEWRDESLWPDECKKCAEKGRCQSGCRVDAYPITGRMDSMDTTANLQNLPIQYTHEPIKVSPISEEDRFTFNKEVKIIDEHWGYRLDSKIMYTYVTPEFKNWIISVNEFTLKSFMAAVDIENINEAYYVVGKLLSNDVIKKL